MKTTRLMQTFVAVIVTLLSFVAKPASAQQVEGESFKPKFNVALGLGAFEGTQSSIQEIYGIIPKLRLSVGYTVSEHFRIEGAYSGGEKQGTPYSWTEGGTWADLSSKLRLSDLQATAQYLIHGNGFMVYLGGGLVSIKGEEEISGTFIPDDPRFGNAISLREAGNFSATGAIALVGVEIPLGQKTLLYLQSTGTSAKTTADLGEIDIGGSMFEAGVRSSF